MTASAAKPSWRSLGLYLGGQSLSSVGDALTGVAFPVLLLQRGLSAGGVGYFRAAHLVMIVLITVWMGPVVDRRDRRRMLISADLTRAAAFATVPVLALLGLLVVPLLLLVQLASAVGTAIFPLAFVSFIAESVPAEERARVNSLFNLGNGVATAIGPGLAGWICDRYSSVFALGIDAGTFLLSASCLLVVGRNLRARPGAANGATPAVRDRAGLGEGFRIIRHSKTLRWLLALVAAQGLFGFVSVSLFVVHLKRDLALSARELGIALSVASVGGILGALAAPLVIRGLGLCRALSVWAFVMGAALLMPFGADTTITVMCTATLVALASTASVTTNVTLQQRVVPVGSTGRVLAVHNLLLYASGIIGAAAAGGVADRIGLPKLFAMFGLMVLASALRSWWAKPPDDLDERQPGVQA